MTLASSNAVVFDERTWLLPVSETEPVVVGASAKIQDNSEDDKTNDSKYFDGSGGIKISQELQ